MTSEVQNPKKGVERDAKGKKGDTKETMDNPKMKYSRLCFGLGKTITIINTCTLRTPWREETFPSSFS